MNIFRSNLGLAVLALIVISLSITACRPQEAALDDSLTAINAVRESMQLPDLPLEYTETTSMINAPDPGRKVAVYADEQGRRYSLDTLTNQVVEIDARSASDGIAGDAQALTQSELEAIAMHYVEAVLPDFADVQSDLQYEPGQKGTFYFFSWYAVMQPGQMNRPFIQIGLHESGALFAYYNTVLLAE